MTVRLRVSKSASIEIGVKKEPEVDIQQAEVGQEENHNKDQEIWVNSYS